MARRDGTSPDPDGPSMARNVGGQRLYLAECTPAHRANVVLDNTDPDFPTVLAASRLGHCSASSMPPDSGRPTGLHRRSPLDLPGPAVKGAEGQR